MTLIAGKRVWTPAENAMLRDLASTMTARQCAAEIGRSRPAVEAKALRLGVSFTSPDTNTARGRVAEARALELLPGAVSANRDDYHAPYDIVWKGQRIDVKRGHRRFTAATPYFAFDISQGRADAYLLLHLDEHDQIERAWLVPVWAVCGGYALSIGAGRSKYSAFEMAVSR